MSTLALNISVIIPVRDGGEEFRRCLAAFSASSMSPYEIIIVVDGATDGSAQIAETYGATVIRLPIPQGPARARNIGARAATGDVLLFVDADVLIHPETVRIVSAGFKKNNKVAAIFGSYDDEPGATNFLSQYKNLLHHFVHQTANEMASTFWSGCGAILRDVFLAVGGFDENFRQPSIEDIELGYRLRQAGYEIRVDKQIQGKHLKEWRALSLLKSDFFNRAMPWTRLILREGQLINDLNLRVSQRISLLSAYGMLLSIIVAIWQPLILLIAVDFLLLLFTLNYSLYRFFYRKRGLLFMVKAVFWHWLYYLYSGFAFISGILCYPFLRRRSPGKGNLKAVAEKS